MSNRILKIFAASVLSALIVCGLVSTTSAQSKKDIKRANQLAKEAETDIRARQYRAALVKLSEAVTLNPKNVVAHYWKGMAHYGVDEDSSAVAEFDIALAQGYKAIDVYKYRWYSNKQIKNYAAALADLKQILPTDPENENLLESMGEIAYYLGEYQLSLDSYQKAILKSPGKGNVYYGIARTQQKLGNVDGQANAAQEAIGKNTQLLSESFLLLGDARQKQNRVGEAIDAYQRAISADSKCYIAYRQLAELYRSESRIDDAIEISKKALTIFQNDGSIYTDLGWYYSIGEKHTEAIAASLSGTKLLPDRSPAFTNLCRAYNSIKRPELALTACNTAIRLNPNDGETYYYMANANALLGKTDEAAKNYQKAISGLVTYTANNPTSSDGFYLLANSYIQDGQTENAVEAFTKCLNLNPRFVPARANMILALIKLKDKAGALTQYRALVQIDPKTAERFKAEIDKL